MIDLLVISHACFRGVNRAVYTELMNKGYNIELVVPKKLEYPSGVLEADPANENDPPINFMELKGKNPRYYKYIGLIELLNARKPKYVILDADPVSMLALQIGKWARKTGTWFACLSCENLPLDLNSEVKRRGIKFLPVVILKRYLLNKSRKQVDVVFTISKDGTDIFKKEGFKKVVQTPLGFNPLYFHTDLNARNEVRESLNIDNATRVIAYFGRLTHEKGVHLFLDALGKLEESNWLVLMDEFSDYETPYQGLIKNKIDSLGLKDKILFISPTHTDIGKYMNASDLVVVPSISTPRWKEQYGRVIPESMACGKTILASESGTIPELLGNYGYTFPEGDVEQMKTAISNWLKGETLSTKTPQEISSYAMTNFSIEAQVTTFKNAFPE